MARWLPWALIALTIAAPWLEMSPTTVFFLAAAAMLPLAHWMGHATEQLADRMGEGVGGLLNATFGNAAELIIGILALQRGLVDLVKASLTGAILGNLLLVLGASLLVGGWKRKEQTFNATAAGTSATLMVLAVGGLALPSLQRLTGGAPALPFSEIVAGILIVVYILGLVFSLKTHAHLYTGHLPEVPEDGPSKASSFWRLAGAAALVTVVAERLVGATEHMVHELHWNELFIGVVVVAIVGNAAEHASAIFMAAKDRVDLALHIAAGSTLQIALFVAPVLVFAGLGMEAGMDLVFTPLEVVAVGLALAGFGLITYDGRSNWYEGVMLLALYAIIGTAFWFG